MTHVSIGYILLLRLLGECLLTEPHIYPGSQERISSEVVLISDGIIVLIARNGGAANNSDSGTQAPYEERTDDDSGTQAPYEERTDDNAYQSENNEGNPHPAV